MSDTNPSPEYVAALAALILLAADVQAEFTARGVPREEVNDDGLIKTVLVRLGTKHLRTLGLIPNLTDQEIAKEWDEAMFYHVWRDANGVDSDPYVNPPPGIDDPEKLARIQGMMQHFQEQDEERAYWAVDDDDDDGETS
jgi:hypothetical protein